MFLNKRQFSRCKHESVQTSGVLVVGKQKINCQMIELSLGGFAVVVAEPIPDAMIDPLACLKFRGLNYIVRVMRQETLSEGVRIALEQVEEVPPLDPLTTPTTAACWTSRASWVVAVCLVMAALFHLAGIQVAAALSLQ